MLTAIKLVLALLLVGFLIVGDNDKTWPLVTWPMFQTGGKSTPRTVSTIHLRAIAADGQHYEIAPKTLSATLPNLALDSIIERTFDDDFSASERRDAQARLATMVQTLLPDVDIDEIQAWSLKWTIKREPTPHIDIDAPGQQKLLGKFRLADLEAAS